MSRLFSSGPPVPEPDAPKNRAGRLLVASPQLDDGNFFRAVILMLEHSEEGALGVVLNHPMDAASYEVLPEHLADDLPMDEVVFRGGPVGEDAIIMLAEFHTPGDAARVAFADIGVIDPESDPADLAAQVNVVRAFGGYSGWGAGQLEAEIQEDAWIDAMPESDDIFTDEPGLLWSQVLDRKGGQYALLARMPDDPSVN